MDAGGSGGIGADRSGSARHGKGRRPGRGAGKPAAVRHAAGTCPARGGKSGSADRTEAECGCRGGREKFPDRSGNRPQRLWKEKCRKVRRRSRGFRGRGCGGKRYAEQFHGRRILLQWIFDLAVALVCRAWFFQRGGRSGGGRAGGAAGRKLYGNDRPLVGGPDRIFCVCIRTVTGGSKKRKYLCIRQRVFPFFREGFIACGRLLPFRTHPADRFLHHNIGEIKNRKGRAGSYKRFKIGDFPDGPGHSKSQHKRGGNP